MKTVASVALALAALTAWGCDRTPRFRPAEADSTGAVPADSGAIYVQMARERWEDPEQGEEAADLTARVLVQDLRNRPDEPIVRRTRSLLDSLAFGAEVAGGESFVVTNLFARSNPSAGSIPYLLWRDGEATRLQSLEAAGMRLVGALAAPGSDDPQGSRIAVLFTRQGPAGQQPFVFVWQRPPEASAWRLAQALGGDSLGTVGSARFLMGEYDGSVLESRATMPTRGFDECATCPHVYRVRRFRWAETGLVATSQEIERSPYYSFVQFVQALEASDLDGAQRFAADPSLVDGALAYGWGTRRGLWRLAPASSPNSRELILFRGSQEAYRVHFAERGGDWVVAALEPTSRTIE
jgi:hypothetical protein